MEKLYVPLSRFPSLRQVLIGFMICIGCFQAFAQDKEGSRKDTVKTTTAVSSTQDVRATKFLPQYSPLSPNSASSQKFGDYKVNLATGVPGISIPLLTVQEGGISIPVTLNYHSGGFRMNEQAPWTGWGWSLDMGGSVNRTVQGKEDDNNSYINNPITSSKDFCNSSTDYNYAQLVESNQIDTQPDIFSYNLLTKGGKFILGQNGAAPFRIPDYPVQLSYSGSPNISNFDITDDNGMAYSFVQGDFQQVINAGGSQGYVSNWVLSTVRSPNSDDVVTYTYQGGGSQYLSERQWVSSLIFNSVPQSGGHYVNSSSSVPANVVVSTIITQVNPHKITYTNGEVEFIQSNVGERLDLTSSRYLKKINVYNYEGTTKTLIKSIDFTYTYFTHGNDKKRLKLDKVTISGPASAAVETYDLGYWSNTISWDENTDNEKKDFFGYYNGKPNTHLIPVGSYQGIAIIGGAANRSTVDTYMKEAVLKRITYPTKGYTEFDFETNKYNDGNSVTFGGGLRVKSIKSYSEGGQSFMKRYEYGSDAGSGVGKLTTNWTPASASTPALQELRYDDQNGQNNSIGSATQASFTQSGGAVDLNTMDTAPIYYTTVTEHFEDSADPVKNGRNVYGFDFEADLIVRSINYNTRLVRPWRRGNLLAKTTYDKDNTVVASMSNQYGEINAATRLAAGFVTVPYVYEGFGGGTAACTTGFDPSRPRFAYGAVEYQTGIRLPTSGTNLLDNVTTSGNTLYTADLLVAQTQTEYSSGASKTEQITYPTGAAYAADPVAQAMVARNMRNLPLETKVTETVPGSGATVIYQDKRVFDAFSGNNARGLNNNLLLKEVWTAPTGTALEKRVEYTNYNSDGNPSAYVVDKVPTTLLWGYNNQLVVGMVQNADYNTVTTSLSSAGLFPVTFTSENLSNAQRTAIGNFQNATPNALSTWYAHRPHVGVTSKIAPNGLQTYYTYEGLLRLNTIKDNQSQITDRFTYNYATGTPVVPVPSNLIYDGSRNSCSNTDGTNSVFRVFVTGIGTGASVEFSLDNISWVAANYGADGYQVSVPYDGGGNQSFYARPSDNPAGGVISGSLAKCAFSGGVAPPTIAVSATTLCDVTLTASNCSGTVNWSNNATGNQVTVPSGTSTIYSATCTAGSVTSAASSGLNVPTLPTGWSSIDIGNPTPGCTENNSTGILTLLGNGIVDGTSDSFHAVSRAIIGNDVTIIAKISSMPSDDGDRSGIMIRSSNAPDAKYYTLIQDGNGNVGELKRDNDGGNGGLYSYKGSPVNQTWIKVVKTGGSIKGYHSTNANPEANNAWDPDFVNTGTNPTLLSFGSNYLISFVTWGIANQTTFSNISITVDGTPLTF